MPNKKDDIFDVVFSDSDGDRVKNLKAKLNELGHETVVHSEAFWDGCWEHEIDVIYDIELVKARYSSRKD